MTSSQAPQESENDPARLRDIASAARDYFREFDHLIGDPAEHDYPERRALRIALAGDETPRTCECDKTVCLRPGPAVPCPRRAGHPSAEAR